MVKDVESLLIGISYRWMFLWWSRLFSNLLFSYEKSSPKQHSLASDPLCDLETINPRLEWYRIEKHSVHSEQVTCQFIGCLLFEVQNRSLTKFSYFVGLFDILAHTLIAHFKMRLSFLCAFRLLIVGANVSSKHRYRFFYFCGSNLL